MCGIFGYIGDCAIKKTIQGLEKLEYRGYDSSGIAYIDENKNLIIKKKVGKISVLKNSLDLEKKSNIAISHTRWATHGAPTIKNSHPHYCGDFAIVHNGIIENYRELKKWLLSEKPKTKFYSETDTEVVVKLLDFYFNENEKTSSDTNKNILKAIVSVNERLAGSWAIALINKKLPNKIFASKKNSPLTVSYNGKCSFISSDLNAIEYKEMANNREKYFILEDDNLAEIDSKKAVFYDKKLSFIDLKEINLMKKEINDDLNFEHYMQKEIFDTPNAIIKTEKEFKSKSKLKFFNDFLNFENITIIGCGTAYHAGLYGKYIFEKMLNKRISVELSSEFRYKTPIFSKNDLVIAISQSGETADTIAGIKRAKEFGAKTAVITNVEISTITNCCDYVFLTCAGQEIAVAATKSYITQLFVLYNIALNVKNLKNKNKTENLEFNCEELKNSLEKIIEKCKEKNSFEKFLNNKKFFFIGRSCDSNTALEGALKLKEIAYVQSEGYPAGELKHGTLSLVDNETLIIAIITQENLKEKTLNAIHETKARGAKVLIISQFEDLSSENDIVLLPKLSEELMPLVSVIPMQLFAYHMSINKGLNPDKPRNLAKSVTVE